MILLTVGSWHRGFDRLVRAVDELKQQGVIEDEVRAQIGDGAYKPQHLEWVDYIEPAEFDALTARSRLLIAHAGMGTIATALKYAKPIIVMPRKHELGEHIDNHQFATVEALEKEHKIIAAYEVDQLPQKLEQARTFVPAQGQGADGILAAVQEFINQVQAEKTKP